MIVKNPYRVTVRLAHDESVNGDSAINWCESERTRLINKGIDALIVLRDRHVYVIKTDGGKPDKQDKDLIGMEAETTIDMRGE